MFSDKAVTKRDVTALLEANAYCMVLLAFHIINYVLPTTQSYWILYTYKHAYIQLGTVPLVAVAG